MPAQLITTKLHIPLPHCDLVSRPQLIEKLNDGLHGKLTLVTAPAGFGKTTLVVDWITSALPENYHERVAWLSLDKSDDAPIQFWSYFISSIQTVEPSLGIVSQKALLSSPIPSIKTILTSLINEIVSLKHPLFLGLDDYHEISSPDIHSAMEFLIENLPSNFHLTIVSREDPPIQLSRLRVLGQLTEIRVSDLRFSNNESTVFFNDLLSLALDEDAIDALNVRTEGWIAGLHLAALSLKVAEDKSEFVQSFTGSHRFLTDYLIDEVLSHQTPAVQKFLWRTAILERFCTEVCNELIDEGESRHIIRQLEQANLFVIQLDNERRWFRYHHLFAEFLRLRLHENEPGIVPELYRRVVDWFIEKNLHREALQYALQSKDFGRAADLIEIIAPQVLAQDDHRLTIGWVEALPIDLVEQRPFLCVYMAWASVLEGQMKIARHWLVLAQKSINNIEGKDAKIIQGHIATHQAYIVFLQGNYKDTINFAQNALADLPSTEIALRTRAIVCLGNAFNYNGQLPEAVNAFQEAIEISKNIGSPQLALFSYCSLGEVYRDMGNLSDALYAYQQLIHFAEDVTGNNDIPLTGFAQFEIGVISRERNDLESALRQIQYGVKLCQEWHQGEALGIGLLELAETHRLCGEYNEAMAAIQKAREVAAAISPWAKDLVEGFAARLFLSLGNLDAAQRWASQFKLEDDDFTIGFERISDCPPLIRTLLLSGKPQEALRLIENLIERDQAVGRMGRVLVFLVLKFVALDELGKNNQALEVVARAVELASQEKHICPFLDDVDKLIPYLLKLPESSFRNFLLNELDNEQFAVSIGSKTEEMLIEPLNKREREILRLMAVGNSNREIGDELFLSVNTIRWYASQIYVKLGVKNRGAAVARARELELIL